MKPRPPSRSRRATPPALAAALAVALLVAACDNATLTPSPSASTGSPPPASPGPTQAPSSEPSPGQPSPAPAGWPDFATRDELASKDWRTGEVYLRTGFRWDLQAWDEDKCSPRRDDLPDGATDGVECVVERGEPAERVGAFLFPDDRAAQAAFEARLADYGMAPGEDGGCPFAEPGAAVAATPSPRAACYVNEFERANLRVWWPGSSVVIGVLGRGPSVERLEAWARGAEGGATEGIVDPWIGSLGTPGELAACPEPVRLQRVAARTTISYETESSIWLTDPAGTLNRQLVKNGYGSEWSPDGRRLAFITGFGRVLVRTLEIATGEKQVLATIESSDSVFRSAMLAWSPDGRWIAVSAMTDFGDEEAGTAYTRAAVSLVDPTSGDVRRLVDGSLLAWSPDGTHLLVRQSDRVNGEDFDLAAGSVGVVRIVDVATGDGVIVGRGETGSWSADCRFVTLARSFDTTSGAVTLDGFGRRPRLAADTSGTDWAPARADLALGITGRGVWRVSMDDGDARRIGNGSTPAWSEDATRIALFRRTGLVLVDPDGSDPRLVARAAYPLGAMDWSPDGRYLASSDEFYADTCGGPSYGFVVAASGAGVRPLPAPFHANWRPIDPNPTVARLEGERPPGESEGCGG